MSWRLFVICFAGACCAFQVCEGAPSATVLVRSSLFNRVASTVREEVLRAAQTTPIPGEDTEYFSFPSFTLKSLDLGGLDVDLQEPDVVLLQFFNVGVELSSTPFTLHDTILGIRFSCPGHFSGRVQRTALRITARLGNPNGTLAITAVSTLAEYSSVDVRQSFDNSVCEGAEWVLQLFLGNLNKKLDQFIKDQLPGVVSGTLQRSVNQEFNKLPLRLVVPPVVRQDGLLLEAELAAGKQEAGQNPRSRVLPEGDVAVTFTEHSANELFTTWTNSQQLQLDTNLPEKYTTNFLKGLLPGVDRVCHACRMNVHCSVRQPPVLRFLRDGAEAVLNSSIMLNGLTNGTDVIPLVRLEIDAVLVFSNFTGRGFPVEAVKFHLELKAVQLSVEQSFVGDINVALLNTVAKGVLDALVIPEFNQEFKGVSVPRSPHFNVTHVVFWQEDGVILAGANLNVA